MIGYYGLSVGLALTPMKPNTLILTSTVGVHRTLTFHWLRGRARECAAHLARLIHSETRQVVGLSRLVAMLDGIDGLTIALWTRFLEEVEVFSGPRKE